MGGRICGEKQRTCTEIDKAEMEEMRKGTLFLTSGDATYTQRKNMPTVITVLNRDGKCRKEVRKEKKLLVF